MMIWHSSLSINKIRRQRLLPHNGKIHVRVGQEVQPQDIIAETMLHNGYIVIEAVKALNCSPDELENVLAVSVNQFVNEGDVLASKKVLLFEKNLLSPCQGKIRWIEYGKIWIEKSGEVYKLPAGYAGKITDLHLDRGVTIETVGSLCFGVWGNHKFSFGRLRKMAQQPANILHAADITEENYGEILAATTCESAEVFQKAEKSGLKGLVFSTLPPALIIAAQNTTVPILVLEGFGELQSSDWISQYFQQSHGKVVVLNAERDFSRGERGELFCADPSPKTPESNPNAEKDQQGLVQDSLWKIGQKVKVLLSGHHGKTGTITKVITNSYPNGLSFPSAEVCISSSELIIVPISNLEIIV